MRRAEVNRRTRETDIRLKITIEGRGRYEVSTGIRFLDHMLELVARHGAFDLALEAQGDLDVDQHHTVEDVGIGLGEAIGAALGHVFRPSRVHAVVSNARDVSACPTYQSRYDRSAIAMGSATVAQPFRL